MTKLPSLTEATTPELLDRAVELLTFAKMCQTHLAPNPIADLDYLTESAAILETLTRRTVDAAREEGHSWDVIGHCLGITKQAAHQRFR